MNFIFQGDRVSVLIFKDQELYRLILHLKYETLKNMSMPTNKLIIETLTNKVVYCPTKNKNSRKRVHLQMCSTAAFFVELLNSCLIQGIQQFAILNMGVNFPNGSVGKCKYDLFDLHIIQGVEPLTNRQFLIFKNTQSYSL